jgi:GT2 family glycosyltransferase
VLPKEPDWLAKHDEFAATVSGTIFGACLYYDDGSVMHAGTYFEPEVCIGADARARTALRVEHYAKGSPGWAPEARRTRIVPAVTGAFMSVDRAHFERLDGFDEDYVFGSYEDADLCFRSATLGRPVWYCEAVRLWHMEGKGCERRGPHAGALALNKWQFARKWVASVAASDGVDGSARNVLRGA